MRARDPPLSLQTGPEWKDEAIALEPILARVRDGEAHQLEVRLRQARLRRTLRCYALAILIFCAAVIFRILLDFVVPERFPFITFFPAVLLVGYYCGLGPGLLILLLSALTGSIWADPSGNSPALFYSVAFVLFICFGGLNLAVVHYLKQTLQRLSQKDEELAVINRELKHRVKNLFSIASAVCLQTIKSHRTPEEMGTAVQGRIMAIAAAQDVLGVSAVSGAELNELMAAVVATLAPEPARLIMEGGRVYLSAQHTTPLALILHELGTNALKYGAWSKDRGMVKAQWTVEQEILIFTWREHDGPAIAPPLREGLGRTLIVGSLPGAAVSHDLKADGLECHIQLPLKDG